MELSAKSGERFRAAIGAVIRTCPTFPTVAAILTEMDRLAGGPREQREWLTEGEAYEIGKRNAARIAADGLPSDAMVRRRGGPTVHRPGSRAHGGWVKCYDRLIRILEWRIAEREAECAREPGNEELQRRLLVLVRTLAETDQRRAHFAETGETLEKGGVVSA